MILYFAGFRFSPLEEMLLGVAVLYWLLFVAVVFIGLLYLLCYVISRLTKKDYSFKRIFLNNKMKRLYKYGSLLITAILLLMWGYYGLIDN